MKDLKHLYALEQQLMECNNDMVKEACENGKIAVGDVCSMIPEVLLNLPGCFSVRLRAPRTGSTRDRHILHDQPSVRVLPSPGGAGSGTGAIIFWTASLPRMPARL